MNGEWSSALLSASHAFLAGTLVLALGWCWLRLIHAPAQKVVLASWVIRGALIASVLTLFPAWLRLEQPSWLNLPAATDTAVSAKTVPPVEEKHEPKFEPNPSDTFAQAEAGFTESVPVEVEPDAEPWPGENLVAIQVPQPEVWPEPASKPAEVQPPAPPKIEPVSLSLQMEQVAPMLLLPYGVVVVFLLAQLGFGFMALCWQTHRARQMTARVRWVWNQLLDQEPTAIRVKIADGLRSPICFSGWNPTILLPRNLAEHGSASELRWVLTHELDHLKRGDHHMLWWSGLARALFFPIPWFWLVRRELSLAQEYLADAAAAASAGSAVEYAAFLVNLSDDPAERRGRRNALASAGVRAGKSDLFRRVQMLVKWGTQLERRCSRRWKALAACGILGVATVVSGIGLVQADEPKPAPKAAASAEKAPDLAELKKQLNDALKNGRDAEAERLFAQIEKLLKNPPAKPAKPVDPIAPVAPTPPAPPTQPVRPDIAPVPTPRVDAPVPPRFPGQPGAQGQNPFLFQPPVGPGDLRKHYEQQAQEFERLLKDLQDPEARKQLEKSRDEFKKAMEESLKQADQMAEKLNELRPLIEGLQGQGGAGGLGGLGFFGQGMPLPQGFDPFQMMPPEIMGRGGVLTIPGARGMGRIYSQPRLGVTLERPSPVLVEQLDLPKDSGLVVVQTVPGMAADKAGLIKNDILLQFAGKDVPQDVTRFTESLRGIKANEAVEAVVMRKGKKETIKGITLPELPPVIRGNNTQMQIQVNGNSVTMKSTVDGVSCSIEGELANGKITPSEIVIKDGEKTIKAESVEKVPEQYRGMVDRLLNSQRFGFQVIPGARGR